MLQRRYIKRNASTIALGGIFLFFSILLYLTLCTMPCEYTHHKEHQEHRELIHKHHSKPHKTFLAVLILSGPKHFEQRDILRQTWLSGQTPTDVLHFFAIGTKGFSADELTTFQFEQSTYSDLILLPNVSDAYTGLTRKLIAALVWVDANVEYDFLFKADDDTFARLDVMTRELRERTEPEAKMLYWGYFDGRANVKRQGKWAEPDWVLCDKYLPHARGGGYVLAAQLVRYIASTADLLKPYTGEDVSVGAWLAGLQVNRVHDTRFDTEFKSRGCFNKYIVTHKQGRAAIVEKYKNLQKTGQLCAKEFRARFSYEYNWKLPPSQCCIRNNTSLP